MTPKEANQELTLNESYYSDDNRLICTKKLDVLYRNTDLSYVFRLDIFEDGIYKAHITLNEKNLIELKKWMVDKV